MKLAHYFPILIISVIFSCTKPPDYPNEPVLEFKKLSRNTMVQSTGNTDSITITFTFTDGDGDLGNNDTIHDIYLKDTRYGEIPGANPKSYKMPFVPVQGVGNGISGEITTLVYTSCCTYPPGTFDTCDDTPAAYSTYPFDAFVYEIFIKDRAGNESNRIISDTIFLRCNPN